MGIELIEVISQGNFTLMVQYGVCQDSGLPFHCLASFILLLFRKRGSVRRYFLPYCAHRWVWNPDNRPMDPSRGSKLAMYWEYPSRQLNRDPWVAAYSTPGPWTRRCKALLRRSRRKYSATVSRDASHQFFNTRPILAAVVLPKK